MPSHARHLSLSLRGPFAAAALRDHFAGRAIRGVERVDGDRYVRTLRCRRGPAVVAVGLHGGVDPLDVTLRLADPRDEAEAVAVCRALFDLDSDPAAVTEALGDDPLIGAAVAADPGRRVPGAAGATELCVRAILGQQISLAGAATAAGRLVERCGEPLPADLREPAGGVSHLFPTAAALAALDPESLAMPRARGRSLVGLSAALADGPLAGALRRGADPETARARLLAMPGVGPWTADYVVMRVVGDHDVFLPTDLGVRRALERAGLPGDPRAAATLAERWAPHRSYALQYLWGLR